MFPFLYDIVGLYYTITVKTNIHGITGGKNIKEIRSKHILMKLVNFKDACRSIPEISF